MVVFSLPTPVRTMSCSRPLSVIADQRPDGVRPCEVGYGTLWCVGLAAKDSEHICTAHAGNPTSFLRPLRVSGSQGRGTLEQKKSWLSFVFDC